MPEASRTTVANKALDMLGEETVANIDGLPDGARAIQKRVARELDDAIETVLAMRVWTGTRRTRQIPQKSGETHPHWSGLYAIPEDCLKILWAGPVDDGAAGLAHQVYMLGVDARDAPLAHLFDIVETENGQRLAANATGPIVVIYIANVDMSALSAALRTAISAFVAMLCAPKTSESDAKESKAERRFRGLYAIARSQDPNYGSSQGRPCSNWLSGLGAT